MRSCIYCGKELEKGEKCTCAKSAGHRQTESNSQTTENTQSTSKQEYSYKYNDPDRTQYRTGYTRKDSRIKQAFEKARAKREARKKNGSFNKSLWRTQLNRFTEALRDPVSAVQNPKDMSMSAMFTLWAVLSAVMWLCIYFIFTNIPRGPFAMLANIMSFNGLTGYKIIGYMLLTMLSGAVSGIILFFAYTGVFFAINRFVFRDRSAMYKSICQRLALTAVPFTAICVVGALISMFSPVTLMILLLCGAASFVVLTYEALKVQWVYAKPGKVVYGMMLGIFVLSTLICYIIRLS